MNELQQKENNAVRLALTSYLGEAQVQSPMGDKLGHVVNVGGKDTQERAYRNSVELALHTDASDIVAMMRLVKAESAGESPVTAEKIPVFSEADDYLSVSYLRSYIEFAFTELNRDKTEQESRALDIFDEIAHSPAFRLNFKYSRSAVRRACWLTELRQNRVG